MNWQSQYCTMFGEAPSPGAVRALDELARVGGFDDPFFVIAVLLQRQVGLVEDRGKLFLTYAGEIERASVFLRDRSAEIGAASTQVAKVSSFVTANTANASAAVNTLRQRIAVLLQEADAATNQLHSAAEALHDEQLWWRPDLKLVMAITALVTMIAVMLMALLLYRTPAMSVETAATVLVGSAAAQNLVELQQSGDLKALLDCNGEGWQKGIGYCRPVAGKAGIRGWSIAPSASPEERAAPFEQK